MKLGIFAKTFSRPTLEGVLDAVAAHGFSQVQFNLVCVGAPTLPDRIENSLVRRIRTAFESRGLEMAALSGTFNMIHPDLAERQRGFERLEVLAQAAPAMGAGIITLCTGTRRPSNMWGAHPDNRSSAAWGDLQRSMERALQIAERAGIVLGVEPEVTNVMDSAANARRLLDHFKSDRLKVVMDPANLFPAGGLARMREILDEAFALLGPDIVLAHAKDLTSAGDAGHEAAGTGLLDYDYYLDHLQRLGFGGALILHGLAEAQVDRSARFVRDKISNLRAMPVSVS